MTDKRDKNFKELLFDCSLHGYIYKKLDNFQGKPFTSGNKVKRVEGKPKIPGFHMIIKSKLILSNCWGFSSAV